MRRVLCKYQAGVRQVPGGYHAATMQAGMEASSRKVQSTLTFDHIAMSKGCCGTPSRLGAVLLIEQSFRPPVFRQQLLHLIWRGSVGNKLE